MLLQLMLPLILPLLVQLSDVILGKLDGLLDVRVLLAETVALLRLRLWLWLGSSDFFLSLR
jgi:hypothetical protein